MSHDVSEQCQGRRNNLKAAIENIYESKDSSDVTFTVGSKTFKAHKLILASRCSEFGRILLDPNAVTDIIVEDESVTETGFEILLRFIYTDTLGTNDKLSIIQAYLAANHYKQKKLKEKCEELMRNWSLSVEEVCELLNASLGITRLREICLNFIKKKSKKVITSDNFFKLKYPAMIAILDFDALTDVVLKERITKVVEWARKQLRNPDDMAAVRDYCLKLSPPLLGKLKIEKLELRELGEVFSVKYVGLLTPNELTNFMQYTLTKNRDVLPDWCKEQ